MKDASMSLGIYFEIRDAELYGGEGTTGYAATIVEISIEGLQNADFEKYANSQLEAMDSTTQHGRRRKTTSSGTCWRRTGIHTASWRRSSDIQKEPSSAGSWTLESRLGQFGAPPKMDRGRSGNFVQHGRCRIRLHSDRRKAEPHSTGHTR